MSESSELSPEAFNAVMADVFSVYEDHNLDEAQAMALSLTVVQILSENFEISLKEKMEALASALSLNLTMEEVTYLPEQNAPGTPTVQ